MLRKSISRVKPGSDAYHSCPTCTSDLRLMVTLFSLERTRQSTGSAGTTKGSVSPWLTRDIVYTKSFRNGCARSRSDRRSGTINGALSTPGYLPALLHTLHPDHEMHLVGWYGSICSCTRINLKRKRPIVTRSFWIIFSDGSGPPLIFNKHS